MILRFFYMLSFKRLSIATCGNSAAPSISGGREEALHKACGGGARL